MVAFYRDVLGFQIKRYQSGSPYASFGTEGIRFSMYEHKRLSTLFDEPVAFPAGVNGTFSVAIKFDSKEQLASEAARIIAAGARPLHAMRDEPWGSVRRPWRLPRETWSNCLLSRDLPRTSS